MSATTPFTHTQRELAPEFHEIYQRVVAMMEHRQARDADLSHDELRLFARYVELAQVLNLTDSGAYAWAQIQLGDAQYTASLAALGKLDPRHTAINTQGWWRAWQDQWQADGLPPLT
jgi:hypothetical protein